MPAPATSASPAPRNDLTRRAMLAFLSTAAFFLPAGVSVTSVFAQGGKTGGDKGGGDKAPKPEDRQTWPPDKKADEAAKNIKDRKTGAQSVKDSKCPDAKDWDKWYQDALMKTACWFSMKEVMSKVKKSGAGGDKVKAAKDAFGSTEDWEKLYNDALQNMIDCANKVGDKKKSTDDYLKDLENMKAKKLAYELGETGFGERQVAINSCDCPKDKGSDKTQDKGGKK